MRFIYFFTILYIANAQDTTILTILKRLESTLSTVNVSSVLITIKTAAYAAFEHRLLCV